MGAATLEDLLEAGEVQSALILKGDWNDRERRLITMGWDAAWKIANEQIAALKSEAEMSNIGMEA